MPAVPGSRVVADAAAAGARHDPPRGGAGGRRRGEGPAHADPLARGPGAARGAQRAARRARRGRRRAFVARGPAEGDRPAHAAPTPGRWRSRAGPTPGPRTRGTPRRPRRLPPAPPARARRAACARTAARAAGAQAGGEPAAEAGAAPEGPRRNGFLVYRRIGGAAFGEPLVGEPLDGAQPPSTPGPRWARPPATSSGRWPRPTRSSRARPRTRPASTVRDVAAPAAPAGVAVLPREGGLEVLWGPSADATSPATASIATAPGGPRERIAEVGTNRSAWLDETAAAGRRLRLHGGRLRPGRQRERARRAGGGEPPVSRRRRVDERSGPAISSPRASA